MGRKEEEQRTTGRVDDCEAAMSPRQSVASVAGHAADPPVSNCKSFFASIIWGIIAGEQSQISQVS